MWLACSSARAAGSSFAMLDAQRGERCLRLAGALEGEGTQSSGYF